MSSHHDPSGSSTPPGVVTGGYGLCDTVVLVCLAFASGLIILAAVAVCLRRAFVQAYAAGRAAPQSGSISSSQRGLAPSALAAVPKFAYRRGCAAGGWAQCAICLGVVCDGEVVRRLPACRHLFHVECIDMWLYSHATCPLCRCDVVEKV